MNRRCRNHKSERKGTVLVFLTVLLIPLLALVAFSIDLGCLVVARTELQRSADAAASAGIWELISEEALSGNQNLAVTHGNVRQVSYDFAYDNQVFKSSPKVDANPSNVTTGDIVIGTIEDPSDVNASMEFYDPADYNAVKVRVVRKANQNGEVPFFFGRLFGMESRAMEAEATAILLKNIGGFKTPYDGSNVLMLPFALDKTTWEAMLAGEGQDNWTWDAELGQVVSGPDGVLEVNLFPQGTGSPGNRGTVDIGGSNNSTNDIARQIVHGISECDLEQMGGSVELDENGELSLNGDTGISAGVKDELESIIGDPRIIPIFNIVTGPGNNAQYEITAFAGVRITEVKLTGKMSSKRVMIQPANIVAKGAISGSTQQSFFVYSPPWLLR